MTVLDRIVADTRVLLAQRRRDVPVHVLKEQPFFERPTHPLAAALRQPELAVLAELKRASPSKGVIRSDFDVPALARQYEAAGAAAISVLTEPLHFQGSLDFLARAREAVDLPLLRKDFILDPYQLVEARAHGADAVLLIAAVLERTQLSELHAAATELGLSCLVEVYDPSECDRIDFDQVRIVGVNNRDLRTFSVDIDHSVRVLSGLPPGVVRVSESGLQSARDLAHVWRHGIDAVLIGETFMRAAHPGDALLRLRRETRALLHAEDAPTDAAPSHKP